MSAEKKMFDLKSGPIAIFATFFLFIEAHIAFQNYITSFWKKNCKKYAFKNNNFKYLKQTTQLLHYFLFESYQQVYQSVNQNCNLYRRYRQYLFI